LVVAGSEIDDDDALPLGGTSALSHSGSTHAIVVGDRSPDNRTYHYDELLGRFHSPVGSGLVSDLPGEMRVL
jgi:hypothetical protein